MAKPVMGILGGFSGKVGTVVGSIRNGKPTMRAVGYRNPNKVTEKQLIQRERFTISKKLSTHLLPIFEIGLRNEVGESKITNAAVKHLLGSDMLTMGVKPEVNYPKLLLSKGTLPQLYNPNFTVVNRAFRVTWINNSNFLKADGTDLLFFVAIYPEIEAVVIHEMAVTRDAQELEVPISPFNEAKEAHCYLFLASQLNMEVSKTLYFYVADING